MARQRRQERRQAHREKQAQRRDRRQSREERRGKSLTWDIAPMLLLAGAGVALIHDTAKDQGHRPFGFASGRRAASPPARPARDWKDILLDAWVQFNRHRVMLIAAGVTFYALLALFPGIAAFVGLYGLFADVNDVPQHLSLLSFILPPAALGFVGQQMTHLAAADKSGQSLVFVIGLLGSIWSANGAVRAMMTGLHIASDGPETRSYFRRTLISLAFTVGFLAFMMAAITLLAAKPAIEATVGPEAATRLGWLGWPSLLLSLTVGLALLYRFGPGRAPAHWRWITWGSAGVIVIWTAMSALFSAYVANFAHYDRTYGSLGAAVGLMLWIYLSAIVALAGAELNAAIERRSVVDTAPGAPRTFGFRRPQPADGLAAAPAR